MKVEYNLTIKNAAAMGIIKGEKPKWYIPILARLIAYMPIIALWLMIMAILSLVS